MLAKILKSCILYLSCSLLLEGAILRVGNPLTWQFAKQYLYDVRLSGIKQFAHHYNRVKEVETPLFFWGDEVEYGVFRKVGKNLDLSMRGTQIRQTLLEMEAMYSDVKTGCGWQPEYGSWMVEAIPRDPYGGYVCDLLTVEKNMQLRRKRLHSVLNEDEIAPSVSNFPMLGVEGYSHTRDKFGPVANSQYISDALINPHPRFGALTKNIRSRRRSNVDIRVPKYIGSGAKEFGQTKSDVQEQDCIHMDAMAFGMGACCVQVTMQAKSERESRFLHDQLAVLSPLFLALSASTPINRGQLCGTDTRWDIISQSVDDRTSAERRESDVADSFLEPPSILVDREMVGGGVKPLSKSRYSSISLFIAKATSFDDERALEQLNDIGAEFDEESYAKLIEAGVDASLAMHLAHLFTRDPLVIFDDSIYLDDKKALDHFENIQSTNWRTVRWKTPVLDVGLEAEKRQKVADERRNPFNPFRRMNMEKKMNTFPDASSLSAPESGVNAVADINSFGPGWRVEFRPMEIQITDFENAAYAIATVLITRAILAMGYNFYMPMSLVEENMRRAQKADAILNQKFWVRFEAFQPNNSISLGIPDISRISTVELSIDEIFNGRKEEAASDDIKISGISPFIGIIPAIRMYLDSLGCSKSTVARLSPYLQLLQRRASGEIPTASKWIRDFVLNHPSYQGDGVVSPTAADDLLQLCEDIGMGRVQHVGGAEARELATKLLGEGVHIDHLCCEDAREPYLVSSVALPVSPSPAETPVSSQDVFLKEKQKQLKKEEKRVGDQKLRECDCEGDEYLDSERKNLSRA